MGTYDKKDDIILSFIEGIRKLIYATDRQIQKARKEMAKRPIEGIGKELYLLLNAPSLKTQDISVLKGKIQCLSIVASCIHYIKNYNPNTMYL